jgi:small subunit ribosomal protein S6e
VALIKKHVIRRTFKSKKNPDATRQKAPKIQRLVTESRLRRKRIQKEDKIKRWKRTIALTEEYKKVYDTWATKRRAEIKQRKASKVAPTEPKKEIAQPVKAVKPAEPKKVAAKAK